MRLELTDGYIEEHATGTTYMGATAQECMYIMRKTGANLATFSKAYNNVLNQKIAELQAKK